MDIDPVIGQAVSPQGRTVEVTQLRWAYICRHAEMADRLALVLDAIRQPDLQEPDSLAGRERYWLRADPPFPFRWLRVVVEFAGTTDRLITAFGQNNDPDALSS
jgi:hypothetical protein